MQDIYEISAPYWKWLNKKLGSNLGPAAVLQRRTLNTVCQVLYTIQDIPFEKLSSSLYFFCADVEMQEFSRLYEAQLELAGAAPDKFAKGLHRFYNEVSIKIKKENLYADFFDFVSLCGKIRAKYADNPRVDKSVIDCYYSVLLQNLEYLRPDKFNLNTVICGMRTNGELMLEEDAMANFDTPAYIVHDAARTGKIKSQDEMMDLIEREFTKAGYPNVRSIEMLDNLSNVDRVFDNQLAAMLPFINEYTYDILPENMFAPLTIPFMYFNITLHEDTLSDMLRHRSATLPSNGVSFKFSSPSFISEVLMKEVFYNERIIMLYKATLDIGDVCGYYDTEDGFLFSVLQEAPYNEPYVGIKRLLLYLYACAVTRDGPELMQTMKNRCWYRSPQDAANIPFIAEMYGMGGKLRNVYDKELDGSRKNDDKYTHEERSIQGFIRKVGKGKKPSEQAVQYARSLGYELAPDETYVRPFITHVLRLKEAPRIQEGETDNA